MLIKTTMFGLAIAAFCLAAGAQEDSALQHPRSQPLYRVTIISRTTKAINYGHRTEPTKVDFRGTEILADARGDATIESRRGAVLIQARFHHVAPPVRFGPGYLTYVVWAISPEGRPQNLGELVLNGSDQGKLAASTHMQAFALIVTAEPYFSVSQPSDVVVMENVVRPDTAGTVEEVNATYELLPRKGFTYEVGAPQPEPGPAVSMSEYESTLALYEAQSAIQYARAAGADRYAGEKLAKAEALFRQAQSYPGRSSREVVAIAREAAQTAEDARVIAIKRAEADSKVELESTVR